MTLLHIPTPSGICNTFQFRFIWNESSNSFSYAEADASNNASSTFCVGRKDGSCQPRCPLLCSAAPRALCPHCGAARCWLDGHGQLRVASVQPGFLTPLRTQPRPPSAAICCLSLCACQLPTAASSSPPWPSGRSPADAPSPCPAAPEPRQVGEGTHRDHRRLRVPELPSEMKRLPFHL